MHAAPAVGTALLPSLPPRRAMRPPAHGRLLLLASAAIVSADPETPPLRAVLCLFGTVPRSIRFTWPRFEQSIKRLRQANISTDVYSFNLETHGGAFVDHRQVDQSDLAFVKANRREAEKQEAADTQIASRCGADLSRCRFKGNRGYSPLASRNALRQLYSESRVGLLLEAAERRGERYDVVIVAGADLYLAVDISVCGQSPLHSPTSPYFSTPLVSSLI